MVTVRAVTENTERLQPLARNRLQAADFGSAGETVARAVGGAAQDVQKIAQTLEDRYDDAAIKKADTEAMRQTLAIKRNYLSLEGMNAIGAKAKAEEEIMKVRSSLYDSLANNRQKEIFAGTFDRRVISDFNDIAGHEEKQVTFAAKTASAERGKVYFDQAVDEAPRNEEAAFVSLKTALGEIDAQGQLAGADSAVIARKRAETTSAFHVAVAESLRVNDPVGGAFAAESWIDNHAGDILQSDEIKLRAQLQPSLEDARVDVSVGMVLDPSWTPDGKPVEVTTTDPADPETGAQIKSGIAAKAVEQQKEVSAKQANPLRGKEQRISGRVGDARSGHIHSGSDYAAPEGTPVYPPSGGKVDRTGFDKNGGNFIVVTHDDGRETKYMHLSKVLVKAGDVVDANTVMGGVGSTGASSTGNHLHYEVRKNGRVVDPEKQSWVQGALPSYEEARLDKKELYDKAREVATAQNLSPKEYDALLRRVDAHVARNDNLKARAEDAEVEKAEEVLASLGDNFTSVSQIPNFASLPARAQLTYRNAAEANAKAEDTAEAGGEAYFAKLEMAGNPAMQRAFIAMPPDVLRAGVTKGEYARLRTMQVEMKNEPPGGKKQLDTGRVWAEVNRIAPTAGFDAVGLKGEKRVEADKRKQQFYDRLLQEVQGNPAVTDIELQGRARALAQQVWSVDAGKAVPRFEATGRIKVGVPAAFSARVVRDFRAAGRKPPTDQEMIQFWIAEGSPGS